MTETDLQLGGGYKYQWECAILLALNYFFDDPSEYDKTLSSLITDFLKGLQSIQLEGIEEHDNLKLDGDNLNNDRELEDINLLVDDKRILIQVKSKEAEGEQWKPSDRLLLKSLGKFYTRYSVERNPENTCYIFLTNHDFHPHMQEIITMIDKGAISQYADEAKLTKAGNLHKSLTNYLSVEGKKSGKEESEINIEFNHFAKLLLQTRFVYYQKVDYIEATIKDKLQALGYPDWKQTYALLFIEFANKSTRKGGGIVTRESLDNILGKPSEGSLFNTGLTSLSQLMHFPEVRAIVGEFKRDFEDTASHLLEINIYKSIHDHLQDLDENNRLLFGDIDRLKLDDSVWENIIIYQDKIDNAIFGISQEIQKPSQIDPNEFKITELEEANSCLQKGIDYFEISPLETGTLGINRFVSTRASRVNVWICMTAKLLPLDRIYHSLDHIYTKLPTSLVDLNAVQIFKTGIDALPSLRERLKTLVFNHNVMQDIDDELRRIETDLKAPESTINEDMWQIMGSITIKISEITNSKYRNKLKVISDKIAQSRSEDMGIAKRLFISYRKQIGSCFNKLDTDLLNLTDDLLRIGNTLNMLLESLK